MTRGRMPLLALLALAVLGVPLLSVPDAYADGTDSGAADDLVWSVRPTDNAVGTGRPNFGYRADPGAWVQDSLDVKNLGEQTLTLKVYAADAYTPQGGGIDLLRADEPSVDVGTWITLGTDEITVEPQETVTVPFTLTVPPDTAPGDHSGGIVTTATAGSGAFALERRLGSRVQLRVAGDLVPKLELSGLSVGYATAVNPFQPSEATVAYTVANTGNVRLDAHPAVTVSGPFGLFARTVVTEDLGELLPGNSRQFVVAVPSVWTLFALSATVTLEPFPSNPNDAGTEYDLAVISASATTVAVNVGQLVLLGLAVLLVVGALWTRRRRAAAVQAAIDEAVQTALADSAQEPAQPADDQPPTALPGGSP